MNGNHKKTSVPTWRLVGVPILVTFIAIAFWLEYYGTVGWWPVILFAIWAAHYTKYSIRSNRDESP